MSIPFPLPVRIRRPALVPVRLAVVAVTAAVAVTALPGLADEGSEVSIERQALVLVRALSYDNNLGKRAGDALVIAALSKAGVAGSEAGGEAAARAFKQFASVKVQGLSLRSTHVRFSTAAALVAAVEAQGIDVVYVGAGLDAELPAVLEVTRRKQLISIGAREEQVRKGASLGVAFSGGKTTIVVNLTASKNEGTAFALDLLRLAKVIR